VTHDGGKPHAVGDRGQRYEVTYRDPADDCRKIMGWSATTDGADAMATSIAMHPSWTDPLIADRHRPTAGRELDALVAELVVGWTGIKDAFDPQRQEWDKAGFRPAPNSRSAVWRVPNFSTDIANAWAVFETLTRRYDYACIATSDAPGSWDVELADERDFSSAADGLRPNGEPMKQAIFATADTAALAICIAALQTMPGASK
jgi:hypothetical protein